MEVRERRVGVAGDWHWRVSAVRCKTSKGNRDMQ